MSTLTAVAPEYITKGELDMRMGFSDQRTELLITSMKEVLNERVDKMQAIVDKNLAEHKAIASELRSEIKELKSGNKEIMLRLDGVEKRIDDMHSSQSKWFTLFGVLVTAVPIVIALIQSFVAK